MSVREIISTRGLVGVLGKEAFELSVLIEMIGKEKETLLG